MKVMVTATSSIDDANLNKKYSCLNSYNYGIDTVEKERTKGWIYKEGFKFPIRQVETYKKERPFIMIGSLESLMKLMDDVNEELVIHEDWDFPDRLCVEIYDAYRE